MWRQGSGLTTLGAAGGAASSLLSHRFFPRCRMTHAWQAVGSAALGSTMGAVVQSLVMMWRFEEANRQRKPWNRIKRWWKERHVKKEEGRKSSQPARGLEQLW